VSPPVSLSIAVFLAALALWGAGAAVAGRTPQRGYLIAVAIAELELILQAVAALIVIATGHRPDVMGEYLGYLVVTVALLPFALNRARSPEATRWDNAVVAVTCVAVAVAVLRLLALW
jgi:hypothetical protein